MSEGEATPHRAMAVISGAEHAPIIAFDGISAVGSQHGTFTFGLVAGRPIPLSNGTIPNVVSAVAYLKCNAHALQELRNAIDGALAMTAKQQAAPSAPPAADDKPAPAAAPANAAKSSGARTPAAGRKAPAPQPKAAPAAKKAAAATVVAPKPVAAPKPAATASKQPTTLASSSKKKASLSMAKASRRGFRKG